MDLQFNIEDFIATNAYQPRNRLIGMHFSEGEGEISALPSFAYFRVSLL